MKKVFIVHRWDGSPDGDWLPWVKKELESIGYVVKALRMPNPEVPVIGEWVDRLAVEANDYDEDTIFVGHSIGCQTIMRYFETQERKARGAIFVAGWFNLINLEDESVEAIARPWTETPINTEKVKNTLGHICVILGDNDEWVSYKETRNDFKKRLGATVVAVRNGGHITSDDGFEELPQLIDQITALQS